MSDAWFKINVDITEHPKFVGLTADAWTLWIHGAAYVARNLTDGRIPGALVGRLANIRNASKSATELADAGLWEKDGIDWVIHDWTDHNRSAADVDAARNAQASGGGRGNHQRWHVERGITDPNCAFCKPSGTRSGKRSGKRSGTRSPSESGTDRVPIAESDTDTDLVSQSSTNTHESPPASSGPTTTTHQAATVIGVVEMAATALGTLDHEAAIAAGVRVRSHNAHLLACIQARFSAVDTLAALHPDWTADQLVAGLRPPEPPPAPTTRLPDFAPAAPVEALDPAEHQAAVAAARAAIDEAARATTGAA